MNSKKWLKENNFEPIQHIKDFNGTLWDLATIMENYNKYKHMELNSKIIQFTKIIQDKVAETIIDSGKQEEVLYMKEIIDYFENTPVQITQKEFKKHFGLKELKKGKIK